jgi:ubiquinone biosynthesis protein
MFAADPTVHIPAVYWQTTTARVLTLERIDGIKIDNVAALDAAGINRSDVAARVTRMILTMVFEHGFFHAELIDFGMVGSLNQQTRERLVDLLLAITAGDAESLVDAFLDLGTVQTWVNRNQLRNDLDTLLARYGDRSLGEITIGPLIVEAQAIVRRHHLHLPTDLALLLKTVVMSEGLGQRLDPSFRLMDALALFAERMMLQVYSPVRMARKLAAAGLDAARLGADLPKQLRRILNDLEQGRLSMTVQPAGMEPLLGRLERLVNRVVLGVVAAAFVVGLATLMSVFSPLDDDRWLGGFFSIGFLAAVALGVYLAWSILRSSDR